MRAKFLTGLMALGALGGVAAPSASAADSAAQRERGSHTVYIEWATSPEAATVTRLCSPAPERCVVTRQTTSTVRGDLAGSMVGSTGFIVVPATATTPGQLTSWTSTYLVGVMDGPCGAGSFVWQTTMTNATIEVQADGSQTLSGKIVSRIVPGSGTGGYEGVTGNAKDLGSKPRDSGNNQILFATVRMKCRQPDRADS